MARAAKAEALTGRDPRTVPLTAASLVFFIGAFAGGYVWLQDRAKDKQAETQKAVKASRASHSESRLAKEHPTAATKNDVATLKAAVRTEVGSVKNALKHTNGHVETIREIIEEAHPRATRVVRRRRGRSGHH